VEEIHERAAYNYMLLEATVIINLIGGIFIVALETTKLYMRMRYKHVTNYGAHIMNWLGFLTALFFMF